MMKCSTAVTRAIAELKMDGRKISIEAVRERTVDIRGKAVSVRQLMRSPCVELMDAARGIVRSGATPPTKGGARGADRESAKRIAQLTARVVDLEEQLAAALLAHRVRRRCADVSAETD